MSLTFSISSILRPATIQNNITDSYSGNSTTLTTNFTGESINANFAAIAFPLQDFSNRIIAIEARPQTAGSGTAGGYVVYDGNQENQGQFYGGSPLSILGSTVLNYPYANNSSNLLAFELAVNAGIQYLSAGAIDTTNSVIRTLQFGTGLTGTTYSSAANLATYLNTQLVFSTTGSGGSTAGNYFGIVGNTNLTGATFTSTFGTITSTNIRYFYMSVGDGIPQKITLSSVLPNVASAASALQTAINAVFPSTVTVAVGGSNNITITPTSSNRTVTGGTFAITLSKGGPGDPNNIGDGGNTGIVEWISGLCVSSPPTTVPATPPYTLFTCNYQSIFTFNADATITTNIDITGVDPYSQIYFVDSNPPTSTTPGLFSAFGLLTAPVGSTYNYHTRLPAVYLSSLTPPPLNYGGDLRARDLYIRNLNFTGSTTFASPTFTGTATIASFNASGTGSIVNITSSGTSSLTTLNVSGVVTLSGTFSATGNATLGTTSGNTLTVNSTSTFNAPVTLSGSNPNLTLGGTITLFGNTGQINATNINLTGTVTANNFTITNLTVNNTTTLTGAVTASNTVTIAGGTSGSLTITGTNKTIGGGSFYAGTTNPTNTTRLNYDGALWMEQLFVSNLTTATNAAASYNSSTKEITYTSSDRRLKQNIKNLKSCLSVIEALRAVTYTRISNNENEVGFIAQEVRPLIPYAVFGDEDKEMLGFNMDYIVPYLVKAVQELSEKVKEQEKIITQLINNKDN